MVMMEILFDEALVAARRERAFERRADKADFLLDLAAGELADRLSVVERQFSDAVELFGATGITARQALATGKVDNMLRVETSSRFDDAGGDVKVAAIDDIPLEPSSANLIVSPLSAHILNDMPGAFVRIRRALRPDGLFLAAIPGAGTLAELRDVMLAAEAELTGGASPRVIPFADVRDIGALMQRAGFTLPVVDSETYTVRYDSLFPLMRDIRAMGMANPLVGRSRKPVGRAFFLRAAEIYAERYSDPDGRIRATFTIIYASGWAHHDSQQQPLKRGSAKVRLEDALKDLDG
jgi:SAM-dependent methyltransferase